MSILIWESILLYISFTFHFAFWQFYLPSKQSLTILVIFLVTLLGGLLAGYLLRDSTSMIVPKTWIEFLYIVTFHLSVTVAYLISYTLIESDSPSFLILMGLDRAGSKGLDRLAFGNIITNKLFIENRIEQLSRDQLIVLKDGIYQVTPEGLSFLKLFLIPRKILKISTQGG